VSSLNSSLELSRERTEKLIQPLCRNWDWKASASSSLIALDILAHEPTKRPRIKIMTEAGVIGKIGVNEFGVSVMLNALKVSSWLFSLSLLLLY
jgi:isopenicillin-N N-acyltransferase-like protein